MKNNQLPKTPVRSEIKYRSKLIFALMLVFVVIILAQLVRLQTIKKDVLLEKVKDIKETEEIIYADRGNIYATDGQSLLATTIPVYTIAIDATIAPKIWFDKAKKDSVSFTESVDSLAFLLAKHFGEQTKESYKSQLMAARATRKLKGKKRIQYIQLIQKPVGVEQRNLIATFPLFRIGKKGGGILHENTIRTYPFGQMAKRTIGKVSQDTRKGEFGIEHSFNKALAGRNGKGTYNTISGGTLQAVHADDETQPETGGDIITTIDVNLQDMAESALLKRLRETNANYGTVVVMEIKTGEIKAIANYGRQLHEGVVFYGDDRNYAVQEGTDPGSTFKLASIIALLEKKNLRLDEFAANCQGYVVHGSRTLNCSHKHGTVTVQQAFEQSCNVAFYELVKKHFGFSRKSNYFDYIKPLKLHEELHFQLRGETPPLMTFPENKAMFSGTTIPWTSIGYELRLTPLQMLTFYNAVANDGYWVEPIIVKEIRKANEVVQSFFARKIPEPICSQATIAKVKQMLDGVVLHGTADNIKEGFCSISGKTGTAQKKLKDKTFQESNKFYTSFIGYFPSDKPKYSCVVSIDEPQVASAYGNTVAAPVFREIANKVFAYDVAIHPVKKVQVSPKKLTQKLRSGKAEDFITLARKLHLTSEPNSEDKWVAAQKSNNSGGVAWQRLTKSANDLPNVKGMVLRDALFLLENEGMEVRYTGKGKVERMEKQNERSVLLVLK
jgi:cell division protein FtsI (penicillin-binding protein 3)